MRENGFFHDVQDGKITNGLVGVIYSLYDNDIESGGFCCIPGSHKNNFPTPQEKFNVFGNPLAQFIPVKAGDAILFNEALTHGTTLATKEGIRYAVMVKYSPGWMQYRRPADCESPAQVATTINHKHDISEGVIDPSVLSERQRNMLMPAYSRGRPPIEPT